MIQYKKFVCFLLKLLYEFYMDDIVIVNQPSDCLAKCCKNIRMNTEIQEVIFIFLNIQEVINYLY